MLRPADLRRRIGVFLMVLAGLVNIHSCSIEPFPTEDDLLGKWTIQNQVEETIWIEFHSNHEFTVHRGGLRADAFVRGTYSLSRGEITFLNTEGQYNPACEKPGKYRLSVRDGATIRLKHLEDYCPSRKRFTALAWKRFDTNPEAP